MTDVSAWAGIHYYASRNGRAGDGVSPQDGADPGRTGNGHIVQRMKAMAGAGAVLGLWCGASSPFPNGVAVDVFEPGQATHCDATDRGAGCRACRGPRFVANRLLGRAPDPAQSYAPWMVANVTVETAYRVQAAAHRLCWDNVIYGSRSLGYVVATHQSLRQVQRRTVLDLLLAALRPRLRRRRKTRTPSLAPCRSGRPW